MRSSFNEPSSRSTMFIDIALPPQSNVNVRWGGFENPSHATCPPVYGIAPNSQLPLVPQRWCDENRKPPSLFISQSFVFRIPLLILRTFHYILLFRFEVLVLYILIAFIFHYAVNIHRILLRSSHTGLY